MAIQPLQRLRSNTTTVFIGTDRDQAAMNAANGIGNHPDPVSRNPVWPSLQKFDNDDSLKVSSPFGDVPNPDYIGNEPTSDGQTAAFAVASQGIPVSGSEESSFSVFLAAFADNAMEAKIELFERIEGVFVKVAPQPSGLGDFLLVAGDPNTPAVGLTENQPYNWQDIRCYSTHFTVPSPGTFKIVLSFNVTNYLIPNPPRPNPSGLQFIFDIYNEIPTPLEFCLPIGEGSKPKQRPEEKINTLLENNQIPSVLASSFYQMARRYLRGFSPEGPIETDAFNIFDNLSPAARDILNCFVGRVDSLPRDIGNRLLSPVFIGDQPVLPNQLAQFLSQELFKRTSLEIFGDPDCFANERPGKPRLIPNFEGPDTIKPSICSVNEFRTNEFSIDPNAFKPEEFQRLCQVDPNNVLDCPIQLSPCPGHEIGGGLVPPGQPIPPRFCLKVPDVSPGDVVKLQGVNFIDVNAKVRIAPKSGAVAPRLVDAHVCGDVITPVTEVVDGQQRIINDCRVKDIITFKVPEDLPPGIYSIEVIVQNNTGVGPAGTFPSEKQFISILPPATATFQISSVRLDCSEETDGGGSDEVGISILATPIGRDLTPGEMITNKFRFEEVDSGENRDMARSLFRGSNLGGLSLAIVGFEIDSEDAFEAQIQEFQDAFEQVLKSSWKLVAESVGAAAAAVAGIFVAAAWATAIGAAITLAILIFVALWAPADLIIEDFIGLSLLDLAARTSPNFPAPPSLQKVTSGEIRVNTETISKGVTQTVERRGYRSDDEDSLYLITLRYDRLT